MANDTRLATRIPPELDRRLRLLAVLSGRSIQRVLADLLAKELPTEGELAARLSEMGTQSRG
jgi:hypothetical protein